MADDHVRRAHILDHRRRDVAGEGPGLLDMAILGAQQDRATRQPLPDPVQQGGGRADQQVGVEIGLGGPVREQTRNQGSGVRPQPVHLPISGDQLAPSHVASTPAYFL